MAGRGSKRIVGIDLGTTHTVVAWAEPVRGALAEIFLLPQLVTPTEIERSALLDSALYAPLAGDNTQDPWGDNPWVIGQLARRRGAEVAGRLVVSPKSWLCHGGVDRMAAILPWGTSEGDSDVPRLSPVDASARLLRHVRECWNQEYPAYPLADQDVVLTVPASFDEAARKLTLEAAQRAGLHVRLLEEPQAAFYDYMRQAGEPGLRALVERNPPSALVLVCDVGGGTTDLSLIRVSTGTPGRPFEVTRVAVGQHLLLGGDNMDLALAHACEARMLEPPARLDPARFGQLVLACRRAKEQLLESAQSPEEVPVTIAGSGARLVGSTLSTTLDKREVERIVMEGFLPAAPREARPRRVRSALVGFGLPYEQDPAITRHLAWFFARHATQEVAPHALLLNGGVFRAKLLGLRLAQTLNAWGGPSVEILAQSDPDLAVARGAVAFGLALRGLGARIEAGAARGYYIGLGKAKAGKPQQAVCVVPRGAKEGTKHAAAGRTFGLVVGRPVRFELFASDDASHQAGELVSLDEDHYQELPPIAATLGVEALAPGKSEELSVGIEGELTAIGTLELACVEQLGGRRFELAFQLREQTERSPREATPSVPAPPPSRQDPTRGKPFQDALAGIERVFGKGRQDVNMREVKDLLRELERLLGERSGWTLQLTRALFDALWAGHAGRRRSLDHERLFWIIAGYCLRPGFGDPLDGSRVKELFRIFDEALAYPAETRSWRAFWITWRRVAAGLGEEEQLRIRDAVDPLLAPATRKQGKPKRLRAEAPEELREMAALLERVPPQRRSQLGGWILELTWTDRDPRLWAALGRIGSRVPAYASVHHVVAPRTAEQWVDHLLREKWDQLPTAAQAAVQLARVTGDRARDLSEGVRKEVEKRLARTGAKPEWVRAVRELVEVEESDRTAIYGEDLPVGLRLVG